jgi:muramoyltetrapeptide carboxypeptidase
MAPDRPVRRPPALAEGDLVRLVAPAGIFDPGRLERGIQVIERHGLQVAHRPDVFDRHRYLAGTDARRLAELQEAFDDPEAKAVWAIRGGYGAMRLLPGLELSRIFEHPKVFIGFSDVTALHAHLNGAGLCTIHGPVAAGLAETPEEVVDLLFRTVTEPVPPGPYMWDPPRPIREGEARGPLLGGNLSLITRLLGTPYLPDLEGAVLLVEDVGEAPYRIDRMLTHLELAGIPEKLAGVLVGELTACEAKDADYTALDVIAERVGAWGVPAACGFPAGHTEHNVPLVLGLPVTLDCTGGRLAYASSAVVSGD